MRRLIYILPVLAFAALAYFLFKGLSGPPPDEIPSAFVGKPAPAVQLPGLDGAGFGGKEFKTGQVTVVLAALGRMTNIRLYGFAYKDKPEALRAFLRDTGNPYARVGVDPDGRAGIEWGVYYVPETFIVDRHGIIRERFLGPISADNLLRDVLPAIKRASES